MSEYRTAEEREAYDPGPCPSCGGLGEVNWIEVPMSTDKQPYPAVPGSITCRNPDCPSKQIKGLFIHDKRAEP